MALVTEPLPNPAVGLIGVALTGLRSPGWQQFTPTNNAHSAGIMFPVITPATALSSCD